MLQTPKIDAGSLRIDPMQVASVIRRHFLEELVLTHRRTGGCKVYFGLERIAALIARPRVPNATLIDMFRPLSSDDHRTASGARNTSHLERLPYALSRCLELRDVPGPFVVLGYDGNELGVATNVSAEPRVITPSASNTGVGGWGERARRANNVS